MPAREPPRGRGLSMLPSEVRDRSASGSSRDRKRRDDFL